MDRKRMSSARLARKIEFEGGVLAALEFGVRAEDIEDPRLRSLWQKIETRYRSLTPLVTEISQELRRAA